MDITEQKQDEAVNNVIKVYLAQMNSAVKISDIICNHSKDEDEITGDHIISGLIYRLMVPMTDDDMEESLEKAGKFMNESTSDEEYDEDDMEVEEMDDPIYVPPSAPRKIRMNDCHCEICEKVRECISKYDTYETYDPMVTRFKNSIKETCDKHRIYL